MIRYSEIARSIRRVLAVGAVTVASGVVAVHAQEQTQTSSEQTLQTVVVTGSMIKRTDTETPSPVQVVSSADLLQSGYTEVSDVLRNLSANGANTLSQSFGQAFAAGASGVSLRGLTVGDTLVLIDGQRSVAYPLADDNQRSFTDISAIPFNAVDHIDVLKDGASATYGADAIGGVVNVILKKTYTGFEATAEGGVSGHADGTTEHLAMIAGRGDLTNDGWNSYVAVDFRNQDQILADHRSNDLFTNLNWTPFGGFNTTPGANFGGPNGNPNTPYPATITGYLVNPATGAISQYLPGCSAQSQAANLCTYTLNGMQLQPPTENLNILGKFTKSLGSSWQLGIQASFFNSKAEQVAFNYNGTGYPGGLVNPVFGPGIPLTLVPSAPLVITVPANYPLNTTGATQALVYNFHELGQPEVDTSTNTYRMLADLKGTAGGWDIDATAGAMYSHMGYKLYNQLEPENLQNALNNGYIVGQNPTPGGAALFAPPMEATPTSTLDLINIQGQHELFQLPGGPLAVATGVQYFHKVQNETAPPQAVSGQQTEAGGPIFVIGTQNDAAAFLELDADVYKWLELTGDVRYDHYDTYGSSTTPKFGVKFKPFDMLALRGTWGKGFRAPSAAEGGQSGELFGAGAAPDPKLCPNPSSATAAGNFAGQCTVFYTGFQTANTQLKAVTSTNFTGGFIFEPAKQFSVSADYYSIKLDNDIISAFEAGGLSNYTGLVRGPAGVLLPQFNGTCQNTAASPCPLVPTPAGLILAATYPYVNAGETKTSGIDVDLKSSIDLNTAGKLTAELNYTHLLSYQLLADGVLYQLAGTHGPSGISGDTGNPKDRAVLSLTWDNGPLAVTATLNYTSSFSIDDPSAGETSCTTTLAFSGTSAYGARFSFANPFGPLPSNVPSSFCNVGSFTDTDLYAVYRINSNFSLHGSVLNVFDKPPPLDMTTYGGGGETAYDPAFHQIGATGRYFTVGATYTY